jgi:hypothetical protein
MSATRSIQNYKLAKTLYQDIKDDFYAIENAGNVDDGYMIDQTIEDIKKLNRHLGRIDTDILLDKYDFTTVDKVEKNIEKMKEAGYFIEKTLMGMRLYDELRPVIGEYVRDVGWEAIAKTQEEAEQKLANYLTSRDNYDKYKTIVNNIVKGSMKKKYFSDLFNSLKSRLPKTKTTKKSKAGHPVPPEMFSKEGKEQWEKEKERAKKAALKHAEDETPKEFDVMGESFVSLNKYKKYSDNYGV